MVRLIISNGVGSISNAEVRGKHIPYLREELKL